MKKFFVFVFLFVLINIFNFEISLGQTYCPPRTVAYNNSIVFVGKAGTGGDKNVVVWFDYGLDYKKLNYKTKEIVLYSESFYCVKVNNLKPCTKYYYRAVAKNSAGVNYGEIKEIKTKCSLKRSIIF